MIIVSVARDEFCDKCWTLQGRTSASWVPLFCVHTTTRTDIKLRCLCERVGSGGRVPATPVPIQVHANARSHETTPGSRQPRRKLHSHAGNRGNDLVPDQHGGKILPNFSSILIVNKWSVMYPRCTRLFHSDGLVNWLHEYGFWIGYRSGMHFISSRGGFSWRLFWQTLQRSRSAGPSMLARNRQCTS